MSRDKEFTTEYTERTETFILCTLRVLCGESYCLETHPNKTSDTPKLTASVTIMLTGPMSAIWRPITQG